MWLEKGFDTVAVRRYRSRQGDLIENVCERERKRKRKRNERKNDEININLKSFFTIKIFGYG